MKKQRMRAKGKQSSGSMRHKSKARQSRKMRGSETPEALPEEDVSESGGGPVE